MTVTLNADALEIEKFERNASRWWDTEGEFKPLHQMNPVRAHFIDRCSPVAGAQLLDVGCGGGILSEAMTDRGANVTGIDMGQAPLEVAKQHAEQRELQINYRQITAEQLAEESAENFDHVCCLEMLEHVPDPESVIAACSKLTKPGGNVFFSTINRTPLAYGVAILGAEYIAKVLPKGTHDYQKFITPAELSQGCRNAGLQVKAIRGLSYNPISQTFKESAQVSVNYIVHAYKPA